MDIEEIIKTIVDNGRVEDMHELSDILEDTLEDLKKYDKNCYKEYEMKLYEMAYGNNLNREMAEEIVSKMRPYQKKWDIEQTRHIQEQMNLDNINPIDFFVVINMAYNDYENIFRDDIEMYAKFAEDFIEDEDAKEGKVFLYFTTIPE